MKVSRPFTGTARQLRGKSLEQGDDHGYQAKALRQTEAQGPLHAHSKGRRTTQALKFAIMTMGAILLFALGVVAGIYALLEGKSDADSYLVTSLEATLQDLVGEQYDVKLAETHLALGKFPRLAVKSDGIRVISTDHDKTLLKIPDLRIEVDAVDALRGNANFHSLILNGLTLNAAAIGSGQGVLLPPQLRTPLDAMGALLLNVESQFRSGRFDKIDVSNALIKGRFLGRRTSDPLRVQSLTVIPGEGGALQIRAGLLTELSNIIVKADYHPREDGSKLLRYAISGMDLGEWLIAPEKTKGVIGSNGTVDANGELVFTADGTAGDPSVRLTISPSDLRIGRKALSEVKEAVLNFRLILNANQIELDPSPLSVGRFTASLAGGIIPADKQLGYSGPLRYDLSVQQGRFEPTLPNEPVIPASLQLAGVFDAKSRILTAEHMEFASEQGGAVGSGMMDFNGETPALKGSAETKGMPVLALKQYWPFFMARGARKWIQEHVQAGWVNSGSVEADIPHGILFRLRMGAKMKPEHFVAELNLERFAFQPFGEMPPIENASGTVRVKGMQISADMNAGKVISDENQTIAITSGGFNMQDFAAKQRWGEARVTFDGDLTAIASVADKRPMRVMERMKVDAEQFAGEAHGNAVVRFPIGRRPKYEEVDWNVLLDVENGSSSRKLEGRNFKSARILIDANPRQANVTGTANVDGVNVRLSLLEPMGKVDKSGRQRSVSGVFSDDERKALGLSLEPVISGPVGAKISEEKGQTSVELDLTAAELRLPWVGWRKGKKIPATASFELEEPEGKFRLKNFKLKGEGFGASGVIVADKRGVILANMNSIKLNRTDDIQLKLERTGEGYAVSAEGGSYDARGAINQVIHQKGFKTAQGERSVDLVANFKQIKGFSGQDIRNISMNYTSRKGRLRAFSMSGSTDGGLHQVTASRQGTNTIFSITSDNAGSGLAFLDIYSKMRGGKLKGELLRLDEGPFSGPVVATNFRVVDEPRLARLFNSVRSGVETTSGTDALTNGADTSAQFDFASAKIIKTPNRFMIKKGVVRNARIGLSLEGTVFDEKNRTNIAGTFMPANAIDLVVSNIPLIKELISNGRDRALVGITFALRGQWKKPELLVNPLSIVTPGIFNRVFEFDSDGAALRPAGGANAFSGQAAGSGSVGQTPEINTQSSRRSTR